jgi:SAM-dependent methyltransferase
VTARTWYDVWQAKGEAIPVVDRRSAGVLDRLMEMNGYFSPTSTTSLADHEVQLRYVVDALGVRTDDTVYEVGCGAGALLFWLSDKCRRVGGCDFAGSLIKQARAALPDTAELDEREADAFDLLPRYDIVLSNGVFIYFPDEAYARRTLDLMIAKARRVIGVLDVNDAARRDEFEAVRRARQAGRPERYDGLRQLYLDRAFFEDAARRHGLRCRIEPSTTPHSDNARFRYHVSLFKD